MAGAAETGVAGRLVGEPGGVLGSGGVLAVVTLVAALVPVAPVDVALLVLVALTRLTLVAPVAVYAFHDSALVGELKGDGGCSSRCLYACTCCRKLFTAARTSGLSIPQFSGQVGGDQSWSMDCDLS